MGNALPAAAVEPVEPVEPIALAYAGDLPSRYGIVYEVVSRRARISVPNSSKLLFRIVALGFPLALLIYGGAYAAQSLDVVWYGKLPGRSLSIGSLIVTTAIAILLLTGAYAAFRDWLLNPFRRTVLELDDACFVVHDQDARGRPRTRTWHRQSIGGFTVGPVPWNAAPGNGVGLHVRIVGKSILEIMGGHESEVAEWVAARLNECMAAQPDSQNEAF